MDKLSVILLAGGKGQRFDSKLPKQFHILHSKPIVQYSLDCFITMEEVTEIIIVCDNKYYDFFSFEKNPQVFIDFASPGERRQDSVFHGLQKIRHQNNLICIHDAARPFINSSLVRSIVADCNQFQGAAVGTPLKFTLKEIDENGYVIKTPDRSTLWEIQTPQIAPYSLLKKGFEKLYKENITVTDDVSLLELIGEKVKITKTSYTNIKITTPEDLSIAENILYRFSNV